MIASSTLKAFLQPYRLPKSNPNKVFTHTGMHDYAGCYNIPDEKIDELYQAMADTVLKERKPIHLLERQPEVKPLVIDLDFKYEQECNEFRQHNSNHVRKIVELVSNASRKVLDIGQDQIIRAYVFERDGPYIKTGNSKDGIHMIFPDVVSTITSQKLIRSEVMKDFKKQVLENPELGKLPVKNTDDDIVDSAVISTSTWHVHPFSSKPGNTRYELTYRMDSVYDPYEQKFNIKQCALETDPIAVAKTCQIRNQKEREISINPEFKGAFEKYATNLAKKKTRTKLTETRQFITSKRRQRKKITNEEVSQNIKQAQELVLKCLHQWRSDDYKAWIDVGLCLHSVSPTLLDTWIEFSKKSYKFTPGECEQLWSGFHEGDWSVGSLHYWAKLDNPELYREIRSEFISEKIYQSLSATTQDCAEVIYQMFKHQYVCVSEKGHMWYHYKNHRWHEDKGGITLKQRIGSEVLNEYLHLVAFHNAAAIEHDDQRKNSSLFRSKNLVEVTYKLRDLNFKEKLMKECILKFYDPDFMHRLDSDPNLLGFENGVYDFRMKQFRDGRSEDYVSFSTHLDFPDHDFDPNDEIVLEIMSFFNQVFPNEADRDYALTLFASFLQGDNPDEKFHVFTGCHAKGTEIMMADGSIKLVEDIQQGEQLMGDDSQPRNVLKLIRGHSDMYRIVPSKGDPYVVNGDHILCLKATNIDSVSYSEKEKSWKTTWHELDNQGFPVTKAQNFPHSCYQSGGTYYADKDAAEQAARDFMESLTTTQQRVMPGQVIEIPVREYLARKSKLGDRNYSGYRVPVNYPSHEVKLDPYALGYWIGDDTSTFTTMDNEVVDYYRALADKMGLALAPDTQKGKALTWNISGDKNTFLDALQQYKLIKNKHIPVDYLHNSREVRLALLAGILDSVGYYQAHTTQYELTMKSEQIIDDVVDLARSLGFAAYKTPVTNGTNGPVTGDYFRIQIFGQGLSQIPVLLKRKQATEREIKKDALVYSIKIEQVEDDDYYGFTIDQNQRYLLRDTTVTHNTGGNGKSKLVELFLAALGDYGVTLPIALITQKRGSSSGANPELARTRGRRFCIFQEPGENERLNIGIMKEMTGGDKIQARELYCPPFEFKPQFKLVLMCNDKPKIASDDEGTWRRMAVLEFLSRFRKNPNPQNPNEFAADLYLSQKLPRWREQFILILIEYYNKKYSVEGLKEPLSVRRATEEYQKDSDLYAQFRDDQFKRDKFGTVKLDESYITFKSWFSNNMNSKPPTRREFKLNMTRKFGCEYSTRGWVGWTMNMVDDTGAGPDIGSQLLMSDTQSTKSQAINIKLNPRKSTKFAPPAATPNPDVPKSETPKLRLIKPTTPSPVTTPAPTAPTLNINSLQEAMTLLQNQAGDNDQLKQQLAQLSLSIGNLTKES